MAELNQAVIEGLLLSRMNPLKICTENTERQKNYIVDFQWIEQGIVYMLVILLFEETEDDRA